MTDHEEALVAGILRTLTKVLIKGRLQGHEPDDFIRDPDYHFDRVIRHITTARLMGRGDQGTDDEGVSGHLENALVRMAMGLYCYNEGLHK